MVACEVTCGVLMCLVATRHVMSCDVFFLCSVTSCHVMCFFLCSVISCHVMCYHLLYVVSCHVMSYAVL